MDESMEPRIARLESDVDHLYTQVADMKADLRSLRDRVDPSSLAATRPKSRRRDPIDLPLLLIYLLIQGMLLATLAHGFHWI